MAQAEYAAAAQATQKRQDAAIDDGNLDHEGGAADDLSEREIVRRLRYRNEPIKLFGETSVDTLKRLRKLELLDPDYNPDRQRNDLQAALLNVDEEELRELAEQGNDVSLLKKSAERETRTFADMRALFDGVTARDVDQSCRVLRSTLKFLLRMWEQDLGDRPVSLKRSAEGKRGLATFKQNLEYIKPLLKFLKKRVCWQPLLFLPFSLPPSFASLSLSLFIYFTSLFALFLYIFPFSFSLCGCISPFLFSNSFLP